MVGKIKIFLVPEAQSFGDDFFDGALICLTNINIIRFQSCLYAHLVANLHKQQ